jgi:ribosomal protein S25
LKKLTTPLVNEDAIKIYTNDDEEEKKGEGEVSDELKMKREMNRQREAEEAKKQAEIDTKLNLTVADDIKKTATTIISLFKLAAELKIDYPMILKKILDLEKDQNFFLLYFTKQFKQDFFDDLQAQVILTHSREWISLKLTAVK